MSLITILVSSTIMILSLIYILFQIPFFILVYRRTSESVPNIRLATVVVFLVSTAGVIITDVIGVPGWFSAAAQTVTVWPLLFYFIRWINGSKTWIRAHFWQYKWVIAVLIVYQVVDAIFLESSDRRRGNRNNEQLTITLHVIHLIAFFILTLRQRPSVAFFIYNFIAMLQPLGKTLQLFTEFPARLIYCGEYYNCHEYQLKLQYFLFSAFALVEVLPALLLCLDGVSTEAKLPEDFRTISLPSDNRSTLTQEED